MSEPDQPQWILISVLFSSVPLSDALAKTLTAAAFELFESEEASKAIHGEMIMGQVRNLKKTVLLGTLGGPEFEAEVDTAQGSGIVRFFLTDDAIEVLRSGGRPQVPPPKPIVWN